MCNRKIDDIGCEQDIGEVFFGGRAALLERMDSVKLGSDVDFECLLYCLKVEESIGVGNCTLETFECINFFKIAEDRLKFYNLALSNLRELFQQEVSTLLSHYSIVAFKGHLSWVVFDRAGNSRPCRIASASNALSDDKKWVVGILRIKGFKTWCIVVELFKSSKNTFLEVSHQLCILLTHSIGRCGHSKHVCYNREEFHLLGLIVKQLCLFLLATDVAELSSDRWISKSNCETKVLCILGITNHNRPCH